MYWNNFKKSLRQLNPGRWGCTSELLLPKNQHVLSQKTFLQTFTFTAFISHFTFWTCPFWVIPVFSQMGKRLGFHGQMLCPDQIIYCREGLCNYFHGKNACKQCHAAVGHPLLRNPSTPCTPRKSQRATGSFYTWALLLSWKSKCQEVRRICVVLCLEQGALASKGCKEKGPRATAFWDLSKTRCLISKFDLQGFEDLRQSHSWRRNLVRELYSNNRSMWITLCIYNLPVLILIDYFLASSQVLNLGLVMIVCTINKS